ncbi:hypothetical protein HN954_01835 [bacterium]|jgi:hypothetical protein|nr:hypothetical protein [bacterium]MBT6832206.1 hypothetical protein [bacterium]MBT6996151.1 hypothetical protein [bacterium]MBT7772231.1 hypothetical protein [bacterium]
MPKENLPIPEDSNEKIIPKNNKKNENEKNKENENIKFKKIVVTFFD